ncbi:uncharacterized protein LOC116286332 [Actinia tenebrosa]|uniref:Uncharacterized protein LOC116286332 n=1 Tax=Actinia tenebrosa TaxID=6105 RepID=A0A6P8H7J3_ACTTE|nr:uncharacterized protein LOC116286332 [Actinia tenebrosa]
MAADKRCLYHLAPTQTPSPLHRKPLVQGRLETELSPLRGTSHESHDVSKRYSPAEQWPITGSPQRMSTITDQGRSHDNTPVRNGETEQEIPRINPPSQYIEPGHHIPALSPKAVEPSSSLSLSENDDSNSSIKDQTSYQTGEAKVTEVPVETSISKSPVKVVCHSPRRSKTRIDDSEVVRGFAAEASRVEVPGVTKVVIEDGKAQRKQFGAPEGNLSEDSLEYIRLIEGSPVDPNSTAVKVALDENDKENADQSSLHSHHQYNSFMGDIDNVQGGPLSAGLNQSNVRQQLFDYSAVSADSSIAVEDKPNKKKKKKRASRVIPSRYMENKKATPVAAKPPVKKSSSLQTNRKVSFAPKPSKASSSLHDSTQLNTTAPYQNTHSIKGSSKVMTSTPAFGSMGVLPGHPGGGMQEPTPILPPKSKTAEHVEKAIEESGPHYTKGLSSKQISECLDKNREKSKKAMKIKAPLLPHHHIDQMTKQKHEYGQGELSQRQLELEYIRLKEWIFLESKLKSTFSHQEKDAQSQLYSMWQENEKLRRDLVELQLELDERKKLEELDAQLQLQELLAALSEGEQLLGEIDSLTRHRSHKVSNFSKEMDTLAKLTDTEVKEQGRCQELLAAASTLGTQERSLKAHMIQQTSPLIHSSDEHSL